MTRRRTILVLVALLFLGNLVNALNKGGDFDVLVDGGRRVLNAAPMYEGSGPGSGMIGPPFQGVFFVPFALVAQLHGKAAKLAWHATGCLLLLLALRWWSRALNAGRHEAAGQNRAELPNALLPLVAVLLPLQTNFEHQNLNTVLLALAGGAALCMRRNREVAGGALVGLAAALKAFPGLLIVWFAVARFWKAAVAATVVAAVCTASTALFYGPGEVATLFGAWLSINQHGGWPVRGNNQSLFAMFGRFFGHDGLGASGQLFAATDPLPYALTYVVSAALLVALVAVVLRVRPTTVDAPLQMSAVLALSVLASPIAWEHYWTLMFPAFYVVYHERNERWTRALFWVAAVLVSGFSRATAGAAGVALARMLSAWTIAGLLLFAATLVLALRYRGAAMGRAGALSHDPKRQDQGSAAQPDAHAPRRRDALALIG